MSTDPESLKDGQVKKVKVTDQVKTFVNELNSDIQTAVAERGEWDSRQEVYLKRRFQVRGKQTFPWIGAANFMLPVIDSDINRLKPSYVNLAYAVSPVVLFEPYGPEDIEPARKKEHLFDWRLRTQMDFFKPYNLGIEYMLQYGYTVFKNIWNFKTRKYTDFLDLNDMDQRVVQALFQPEVTDDVLFQVIVEELRPDMTFQENVDEINKNVEKFRQGETMFEFNFIETAENNAQAIACNPKDEIFFPTETTDIQKARFVDYRFWVDKNDLKQAMKDGRYEKFSDDEIDGWLGNASAQFSTLDQVRTLRDGTSMTKNTQNDSAILMHEVCTWYDVDGDGIEERVITTYPDADTSAVLRFIENPYDHGQFPYVVVRREYIDAPIMSSRGIPVIDDDFQTGISTLFNQDINAGVIATTPTVVTRKNSVKNLRSLKYIPGQVVETENGAADYELKQAVNAGQSGRFASMQYLRGWGNERVGNLAGGFSNLINEPGAGGGGKKTATEVDAAGAHETQLQALDLQVFQQQMAEVYYQLDALYDQFGPDEEVILITGEQPVQISRREIQGKFNMVPNGRLDNSNPAMRLRKEMVAFQLLSQNPQAGDINELINFMMNDIDPKMAKRVMYTEEQRMQQAQAQQQSIAQAKQQKKQEAIEGKIIEDNLDIRKEALLVPIQGKQFAEG